MHLLLIRKSIPQNEIRMTRPRLSLSSQKKLAETRRGWASVPRHKLSPRRVFLKVYEKTGSQIPILNTSEHTETAVKKWKGTTFPASKTETRIKPAMLAGQWVYAQATSKPDWRILILLLLLAILGREMNNCHRKDTYCSLGPPLKEPTPVCGAWVPVH